MNYRYRGHTADTITGEAADRYRSYLAVGLSERGALRQAIDDTEPPDLIDQEVRVMQLMNGITRGAAERAVARRHGGSIAEARRRLSEADTSTGEGRQVGEVPPPPVVPPLPPSGRWSNEERLQVRAHYEAHGLPIYDAGAAADELQEQLRSGGAPAGVQVRETTTAAGPSTSRTTAPQADLSEADREQLRRDNHGRVQRLLGRDS